MAITDTDSPNLLEAWLEADELYNVAPLPAPVSRVDALAFSIPKILPATSSTEIGKLSKLSIFHDLKPTAGAWEIVMETVKDVPKSAAAITALAWLGDGKQRAEAADEYHKLLSRADPDRDRATIAGVCAAFGPGEGTAALNTWAENTANALENRPAPSRNDSIRADMVRQFARLDVPMIDRDFALRKEIDSQNPPPARIPRLVSLYCDVAPESNTALIWWSAMTLIRLAADPKNRAEIVDYLLRVAKENERRDEDDQPEIDAAREAALRGALFFEGQPAAADREWLASRQDYGTILLALRPNWTYPAPHAH